MPPSNLLLLTADDMNWNSPAFFGGRAPGITPNLDRLAGEGLHFRHGHVTVSVCQPSRQCLMTGRYPHRNGGDGFVPIDRDVPTLGEQLDAAGYVNGIIGKVSHLAPQDKYNWGFARPRVELAQGRDPALYAAAAREFIAQADHAGRPFFLMANSHDPHRPFTGSADEARQFAEWLDAIPDPSRLYGPGEIDVPGFLADVPDVRREIAQYYGSVRRCDDTVGAVLSALADAGHADDTLVMFLSDNGMAFPFAKTNVYLHSTRTPWLVRWPGVVEPGRVDGEHFVSGIDFMPTILDALGIDAPAGMDGRSFVPLLRGEPQAGRERVFTAFYETAGKKRYEMRCVQDAEFGYIFNGWSDGRTRFRNESQGGLTFRAMQRAARGDAAVRERVEMFLYRRPEELYHFGSDPDALQNLADDPQHAARLRQVRELLLQNMRATDDPMAEVFARHIGQ